MRKKQKSRAAGRDAMGMGPGGVELGSIEANRRRGRECGEAGRDGGSMEEWTWARDKGIVTSLFCFYASLLNVPFVLT